RQLAEARIPFVLNLPAEILPRDLQLRLAGRERRHFRDAVDRSQNAIRLGVEHAPRRLLSLTDDVALNEERVDRVRIAYEADDEDDEKRDEGTGQRQALAARIANHEIDREQRQADDDGQKRGKHR